MEFEESESSSSEEENIVDQDSCSRSEIESLFSFKYNVLGEQAISLKKDYVLHLDSTNSLSTVAAGTSNGSVHLFQVDTGNLIRSTDFNIAEEKSSPVCGVQFLEDNENLLLIGSTSGYIDFYDIRTKGKQFSFEDNDEGKRKPISCFDVNANSRIICAGTDQIEKDAFLLFFDIRKQTLLGGYWESHKDDITAVKYHPRNPDCLCTGSTDGLINIFDISETSEDDALKTCINSDSSVQRLNWHRNIYEKDVLSCITHTNDLHIYNDEGDTMSRFTRADITRAAKRTSVNDYVLINCHNAKDESFFLLSGSNFHKGEILRSLEINNQKLIPRGNFENNKQIIRESLYNSKHDFLLTGGESGIVTLWTKKESTVPVSSALKDKSTNLKKNHKQKPY